MATITTANFQADAQGRRFTDVISDDPTLFDQIITFFQDPHRQQRMIDAEIHHDRPALGGVIVELEYQPWFDTHMMSHDAHETQRLRQAIGVLVRIIMESCGFETAGTKGSLGRRAIVKPGTKAPGAYHNVTGTSFWFGSAERYRRRETGNPYKSVAERAEALARARMRSESTTSDAPQSETHDSNAIEASESDDEI